MAQEIIISGKTIEQAMSEAQIKYNGDNVQFEVLEMPKKGIFGIGASLAKIKVIINDDVEEDTDLSGIVASIKGLKNTPAKSEQTDARPAQKAEKAEKPEKAPSAEEAQKPRAKAAPQSEKAPAQEKAEPAAEPKVKEPRVIEVTEKEKACALDFANTLLADMGIDAKAEFCGSETSGAGGNTYPRIVISGEGAGILIGHHGETLDAIQYLVNLCAHRKGDGSSKDFVKIVVDIEDYRRKREETLRALARRMAAKALKYKRNVVLEPMNPFERRIIHSEIQGIENVSTHSVGSDENRKIVVCYEGADKVERRRRPAGSAQ